MKRSGNKIIVQLADLHLNELVDLDDNKYDFYVAASRLEKYANEAKMMAAIKEVDEILVAMTGDILNSDRRTDELLNAATNRAHASVLATKLIANFIMDLNSVANVAIISVTGNESRVREEFSLDNFLVSDSYDFLIYSMLKMLLENKDGVRFIKSDSYEAIVRINGANILLMHGTTVRKDTQQSIQQLIGKYAVKGNRIDYVIFGHIHFANVTDLYSRSGSLVGQNTYADRELNLISQASQIIHIIDADGSISNYRVNLQNADDYVGYEITSDYDAYEPRLSNYSSKNKIIEL
jgi:predicted phosphodiesterase